MTSVRRGLLTLAVVLAAAGAATPAAHAGSWIQVSCVNPNGTAAPSEGWSDGTSGGGAPIVSTQCGPGTPLVAEESALAAAPAGAEAYLLYQPPAGSKLIGGTLNATLTAYGYGDDSTGKASAVGEARLHEPGLGNVFFQCVAFFQTCGSAPKYSGPVALPSDAGGDLYAEANCYSQTGTPCDANSLNGAWSLAEISSAQLELSNDVSPQGTGFSGSGLNQRVRGTGHIVFTASEPDAPGIYWVGVALDGRSAWSGTPNTNGGKCVLVGSSGGALMFDYQQPCLTSEVVDVPVPTKGLPDGSHELAITVVDAAANQATVLDQTITTSNPQTTPLPKGKLRARFVISWSWVGATTRLRHITVSHLPRGSGVTATCTGRHCPRLKARHVNAPQVKKLLRALDGRRFHAGDILHLTVSARHRRPERILLAFHSGREPTARLKR